jgi:hypothetical protein
LHFGYSSDEWVAIGIPRSDQLDWDFHSPAKSRFNAEMSPMPLVPICNQMPAANSTVIPLTVNPSFESICGGAACASLWAEALLEWLHCLNPQIYRRQHSTVLAYGESMQRKIGSLSSFGLLATVVLAATLAPSAFAGGQVPTYGNPVSSCSGDPATTTVTGTVYVPNGVDPLPNALVYIPSSAPGALTPGVECLQAGATPQGGAVTSTTTAADGTFTLTGVPAGTHIPIVIQSGKWRIQRVISTVTACTNTVVPAALTTLASNQLAGDIPKIAIVTGNNDAIECILRKAGVLDSEFTNPSGSGRINLYQGSGAAGVQIDSSTPSELTLVNSASMLNNYDVILFPSQGTVDSATSSSTNLGNVYAWANSGGRLFASHSSFGWLYDNPTSSTGFGAAVQWNANQDNPITTGNSN